MDQFLTTATLPKLNQEEVKILNRLITNQETEIVTKNFHTKKSLRPGRVTAEFNQTFKEDIQPILKLFLKKEK